MKSPVCFNVGRTFERPSSRCWIKAAWRLNRFQGRSRGLTQDLLLSIVSGVFVVPALETWPEARIGSSQPNSPAGHRCDAVMGQGLRRSLDARENAHIIGTANCRETFPLPEPSFPLSHVSIGSTCPAICC